MFARTIFKEKGEEGGGGRGLGVVEGQKGLTSGLKWGVCLSDCMVWQKMGPFTSPPPPPPSTWHVYVQIIIIVNYEKQN